MFADDVTQIIEHHHASKRFLALKTQREIERIDRYEKQWKIKTSQNKFKILSISATKPHDVVIQNRQIPFDNKINILGFQLSRTGFNCHITDRLRKAKAELNKLKRFKNLTPKIKTHLYKAFIMLLVEYPALPTCNIADSNKMKLQRLQNKAIKFIISNDEEELSIKRAHEKYKLEAYNVRLHKRGLKVWDKLSTNEPELTERSLNENQNNDIKDHNWWRRLGSMVENNEPQPKYT